MLGKKCVIPSRLCDLVEPLCGHGPRLPEIVLPEVVVRVGICVGFHGVAEGKDDGASSGNVGLEIIECLAILTMAMIAAGELLDG
jgi:hypothetical protein